MFSHNRRGFSSETFVFLVCSLSAISFNLYTSLYTYFLGVTNIWVLTWIYLYSITDITKTINLLKEKHKYEIQLLKDVMRQD